MTKQKILVALMSDTPIAATIGQEVDELTLEELIETEPRADELLRTVREAIGRKLKDRRAELGLSVEEVRDQSNKAVSSSGISRLERGMTWSSELAATALKFYDRIRTKQERAEAKAKAKA